MIILNDIANVYFESSKILHSLKTFKTNKANYHNHIELFIPAGSIISLGLMQIHLIKYSHIQALINHILEIKLSPKTAKNILTVISKIFSIAIRDELVSHNPCKFVEIPKFDNKRYFNYGVEIQKDFLKSILIHDEPIYKDLLLFLFHGRRLNEVLSIKFEMIDFSQRQYQIPAQINKAKKNDTHKMTDILFDRLFKYYLHACIDQNTKYPQGFVFQNPYTHKKYADLKKPWKRFIDKFDLPYIRLHDIRHLIGTYTINTLNQPIEKVSHVLGHSDIKITQIYVTKKSSTSKEVIDTIFESLY